MVKFVKTAFLWSLVGIGTIIASMQSPANATTQEPCETNASNSGSSSITVSPISNTNQTYCMSAYGWSDTWFPTSAPSSYNQSQDILSGDDAPGLTWTGMPTSGANSYKFFTPWADVGNLDSQNIGSNWSIVPGHNLSVSGNVGTSEIALGGVMVLITTTVNPTGSGLTESVDITNTNSTSITGLNFYDYFNVHPDGSSNGGNNCGITSFFGNSILTTGSTGSNCGPVVSNGEMTGSAAATQWDVGTVSNVLSDLSNFVNHGTALNDSTATVGPGDTAGVIDWNLGMLGAGQSEMFTISKNVNSPPIITGGGAPAPEPGTMTLLGSGVLGLALSRRRKKAA